MLHLIKKYENTNETKEEIECVDSYRGLKSSIKIKKDWLHKAEFWMHPLSITHTIDFTI